MWLFQHKCLTLDPWGPPQRHRAWEMGSERTEFWCLILPRKHSSILVKFSAASGRNVRVWFSAWPDFSGGFAAYVCFVWPCVQRALSQSLLALSRHENQQPWNRPLQECGALHQPQPDAWTGSWWGTDLQLPPILGCVGETSTRSLAPWPSIASWQVLGHTRWKPGNWMHPSLYSGLLVFPP